MAKETEDEQDDPNLSKIVDKLHEHIDTRLEYMRLIISEKLAIAIAKATSVTIVVGLFTFFFLFINVAAAMWIGKHYNDYAIGFGSVSLFYLLLIFIYLVFRKPVFERKIEDAIIKSFYEEREEDEDED